jgi:hypothetical protein
VPLRLLAESTIERGFGWVFFYDVDPEKSNEALAGNGPLIVDRGTGELHLCGTAYPAESYIEAYERTGSLENADGV